MIRQMTEDRAVGDKEWPRCDGPPPPELIALDTQMVSACRLQEGQEVQYLHHREKVWVQAKVQTVGANGRMVTIRYDMDNKQREVDLDLNDPETASVLRKGAIVTHTFRPSRRR